MAEHLVLPGDGLDPVHPLAGAILLPISGLVLLLRSNVLGEHLILHGDGLDPVHPLAGDTFLPAARLILILLGCGLDPFLSLAGTILLPGADLLLVFGLWDLDLGVHPVHPTVHPLLLRSTVLGKHLILPGDGLNPVHPLAGDPFLPADFLILLLLDTGLDPVLCLAGTILLPE